MKDREENPSRMFVHGVDMGERYRRYCRRAVTECTHLWCLLQYYGGRMYKPRKLLQVVGYTPVEAITKKSNLILCDVFSTCRGGRSIGTQEFLLLDTDNWDYEGIRYG